MFCKNCGTQVPDGVKFCNNCGTAVTPKVPVAPQEEEEFFSLTQAFDADQVVDPPQPTEEVQPQEDLLEVATKASDDMINLENQMAPMVQASEPMPVYQPPVQPDFLPEKKKNKGLIAGIVIGIIGVIIIVFCVLAFIKPGFLLAKDEETTTAEDTSSTSSVTVANNDTGTAPDIDLSEAEDLVDTYIDAILEVDVATLCDAEILGWSVFEYAFEDMITESFSYDLGYEITIDEFYAVISEEANYPINDAETLFKIMLADEKDDSESKTTIVSSKVISKSDADPYINKTKSKIDDFSAYGLNSNYYDWDKIETYARIDCVTKTDEGNEDKFFILGLLDGEWKVLYLNPGDANRCLASLSMLEGFASSMNS